jgi:hypothetical protein
MAKRFLRLYLRSSLNLGIAAAAAALVILAFLFAPPYGPGMLALAAAAYAVVTAFLVLSKRGASEIAGEEEEDRQKSIREKVARYAALREKIAVLRIGDEEMRKALEYFLLASGEYLAACGELGSYSPAANAEIDKVLEVCQIFLGEMDESSTERRYAVKDGADFRDTRQRTVAAVRESAAVVKRKTDTDLRGLTREERMGIIEEIGGKQ